MHASFQKYHSNRRFSICVAGPKVILPLPRSQQLGHNLSRNWTHKMFSEYVTTKPLLVNVEGFVLRWKTTQYAGFSSITFWEMVGLLVSYISFLFKVCQLKKTAKHSNEFQSEFRSSVVATCHTSKPKSAEICALPMISAPGLFPEGVPVAFPSAKCVHSRQSYIECYLVILDYTYICIYIYMHCLNECKYICSIYANHQPHIKKKYRFAWFAFLFDEELCSFVESCFHFLMRPLAISRYCCFLVRNISGRLTIWLCFANEPF